ncbi:MAG TPA: hypothetical protein VLH56_18945 [Dissulfurispiraceae bacterium]|nr:hypothetical protein [Dissulfurispiraceae bacterium]
MNWLKIVIEFFPVVLRGVIAVENALVGATGQSKKEVVLAVINAGAETAATAPAERVQVVGRLIDTVVDALNTAGIFTHGKKN